MSGADKWSAVAAWVALAFSVIGYVLNFIKSKDAKIQAVAANDRAEEALAAAKRTAAHLETLGRVAEKRSQDADAERRASARARQLLASAHQRGSEQYVHAGELEDVPFVGCSFPVTDDAERIALLKATETEDVRLDPPNPEIGGTAHLSVPNRRYRWKAVFP
jgi:hypothetical protein